MQEKIAEFKKVRLHIKEIVDKFPEERRLDILFDKWSLKDIVAHLNNWMVHDVECLTAIKQEREPYWEPDIDEFNAKGIEVRKDKDWEEIYQEFIALGNKLIDIYETFPYELWGKPIWNNRTGQTPHRFLDDDISHWKDEHLGDLKEKLSIATASWVSAKARLRNSPLGGKGLYAVEPIDKDEKIVIWKGYTSDKKAVEQAKREGKVIMQWDEDLYTIEERGDDIGYYVNHSCEPNLWMEGADTLTAMRNIEIGEELTADYAMWESDKQYLSKWECNCGYTKCRKKVTGMDWKLYSLQSRYKGHFSPLIDKRIQTNQI